MTSDPAEVFLRCAGISGIWSDPDCCASGVVLCSPPLEFLLFCVCGLSETVEGGVLLVEELVLSLSLSSSIGKLVDKEDFLEVVSSDEDISLIDLLYSTSLTLMMM